MAGPPARWPTGRWPARDRPPRRRPVQGPGGRGLAGGRAAGPGRGPHACLRGRRMGGCANKLVSGL